MSLPYVIYWPPSNGNTGAIASTQALTEAGNLTLNTNIPNILSANPSTTVNTGGPYIFNGIARAVSITSTVNLSASTITITGLGSNVDTNGNPIGLLNGVISETFNGPNNSTVNSAKIYTQVNSISIDEAAANISAGFGQFGITNYVFPDYNKTGWYTSVSAQAISNTGVTYTGMISLNRPSFPLNNGQETSYSSLYGTSIPAFFISTEMNNATTSKMEYLGDNPVSSIWFAIKSGSTPPLATSDAFVFTVLQQGIV